MPIIAATAFPRSLVPGELLGFGVLPPRPPFVFQGGPIVPPGLIPATLVPPSLLGSYRLALSPYRSPSPTGWGTTSRRAGPDPQFTASSRGSGQG